MLSSLWVGTGRNGCLDATSTRDEKASCPGKYVGDTKCMRPWIGLGGFECLMTPCRCGGGGVRWGLDELEILKNYSIVYTVTSFQGQYRNGMAKH